MLTKNKIDSICFSKDVSLLELLEQQDVAVKKGLSPGITLITNDDGVLVGTITDGDIRRASIKHRSFDITAEQVMQSDPISFPESYSYKQILSSLPIELAKRGRGAKKYLNKIVLTDIKGHPTRIIEYHQLWEQKVATHRHIVVLGMGYVGFTLALALADVGFKITGVDINEDRINALKKGDSYIHEKGLDEIFERELNNNFTPSTTLPNEGDVYIISVGTPVYKSLEHDLPQLSLDALQSVATTVGKQLKPGNLVVLRSTVPVGTTRTIVLPILEEQSGLTAGVDFHLSFAPERTAEGKAVKELRELPQLIGGVNQESLEATAAIFRDLTTTIVRLKELEQAEFAKLLNNCFRDMVFGFANHVAQIANHFNVNIEETIRAANQGYPRNPIPLPSPGVGGPCLTKDPYIFSTVAHQAGIDETLFVFGRKVNESMHDFIANRIIEKLKESGKPIDQAKILVCGLAFKGEPETGDLRNSTSVEIANIIKKHTGKIYGHDPVARKEEIIELGIIPTSLPEGFDDMDAVLFLNNHRSYEKLDLKNMLSRQNDPAIVFDGWGLFNPEDMLKAHPCVYMGLSFSKSSLV